MKKRVLLIGAITLLSACVSGRTPGDSYTSPTTGQTTLIQSDKEMCENSCNGDYNRCMDTQAASQSSDNVGINYATQGGGTFGAAAQCRSELSSCLPSCKSR